MAEGGGLFHRTMTRIAFFTGGATVCYAFSNPDEGNVYDIFPTQKSKHAFINSFTVSEENKWEFESKWKDLARFYQQQEGYLFNKLIRSKEPNEDGNFNYYGIMQWTTGESFIKSTNKTSYKTLVDDLPLVEETNSINKDDNSEQQKQQRRRRHPLMYKIVVDDTEFDPNETFAPYNQTASTSGG
jgi:heme-degrading monooxygenase HmoA